MKRRLRTVGNNALFGLAYIVFWDSDAALCGMLVHARAESRHCQG